MSMLRSRWAAVGAAVAVTVGAGGVSLTQAAIGSGPKPVYVALDAPCRVIDTRLASPIGAGDANTLTVQITGNSGDCTGSLAVPTAAVAVATNVTVIQPDGAASGRSYFTVYPADAALPTTSNLNFVNGQAPTPNKVDVGLSTDGKIKIYNFEGTAHAAVDIFGYYIDHNHDDRYYTEVEVDSALATKANTADVYTKAQTEATFIQQGDVVMAHSSVSLHEHSAGGVSTISRVNSGVGVSADGGVIMAIDGPRSIGGVEYGLKSMTYCISSLSSATVDRAWIYGSETDSIVDDPTDRTTAGCYTLTANDAANAAYDIVIRMSGGGSLTFESISTTRSPALLLTASVVTSSAQADVKSSD